MLRKLWNHFEEYLLVYSLVFTVFLIFFQIIMRYVFHSSLSWSEELARYVFLWQIWLGASYAVKQQRHLRIEAFKNMLPKKAQKYAEMATLLIWFGFSIFLAYKGSELVLILVKRGQVSPAMRIPMAYAYASVPVGCSLMAIRLIERMVEYTKLLRNRGVS